MSFTTYTKFLHLISAQNIINFRLGCNAIGCTNIRKKDSDISSQRIPPDTQGKKQICKLWLTNICREPPLPKRFKLFHMFKSFRKGLFFT